MRATRMEALEYDVKCIFRTRNAVCSTMTERVQCSNKKLTMVQDLQAQNQKCSRALFRFADRSRHMISGLIL